MKKEGRLTSWVRRPSFIAKGTKDLGNYDILHV